jgi:tetratricopeptide (TPR) repeat protein
MSKESEPKKSRWGSIVSAVVVCSAVFAFIYKHTVDSFENRLEMKNDTIHLLERENKRLTEEGPVPEAVKRLEKVLIPLALTFPMDPLNGRVTIGVGQENATQITMLIIEAEELIKEKKFDLAVIKLDEIEEVFPGFPGTPYFRFLIEMDKENEKEAVVHAEQAIQNLPDDRRILSAYKYAVKVNIKVENKKKAEDLCLTAIKLDPDDNKLRDFFKSTFGYEPSISKEKE